MNNKICIVISGLSIGGAQRRAVTLANAFARKGFAVNILALSSDESIEESYFKTEENVELTVASRCFDNNSAVKIESAIKKFCIVFLKFVIRLLDILHIQSNDIKFLIRSLRKSTGLYSYFKASGCSAIISFEFDIFDRVYWPAKHSGAKIIYAETNSSKRYEKNSFAKQIEKLIQKSDAMVLQTREEMLEHNLEHCNSAYVIHNPIKESLPERYTGERQKLIVNFCRMTKQKNLLLLIQAFEKFAHEKPDYELKIYADLTMDANGEYQGELLRYVAEHNLEKSVHILPAVPDIHEKILDAAMFVSSSDFEGISNSMIEAMAIGLPCVCTDCAGGGAREMITDGENGLLTPVGDVDKLSEAMIRMISEDGLAEKCGNNAAKIRETHSVEKIAEQWLDVVDFVFKK